MKKTQSKKRIQKIQNKKKQFNTKRKKKIIKNKKGGSFSSDMINKEQAAFFFGHGCIIGGEKALFKLPNGFKLYTGVPTNCVGIAGCSIKNIDKPRFDVIAERYQLLLYKHQHKVESPDFPMFSCVSDDYTELHLINDILTNKINVPSDTTSLKNCPIKSKEGKLKKTDIHLWTDEDWVPDMYLSVFEAESLIKDTFSRYGFIHFNDNHLFKKSSERDDEYDILDYKDLFVPKNNENEEELYSNNRLYYSPTLMSVNKALYTNLMEQFLKKQRILLSTVIQFLKLLNIKELYTNACRKMCSPEDKDIITLANEHSIDGMKRVDSRKESEESIKRTDSMYKIKKNMKDTHISYETLLKNIKDDKVMVEDDEIQIPTTHDIDKMNIKQLETELDLLNIYEDIYPHIKMDIKKTRDYIEQHIEKLKK